MKTPIEKHWKTFPVKILSAAVAACFASLPAHANPTSPTVTNGAATFKTTGSTLTVTNTPNTIINWANFSINTNETTRFVQQSAASAVLNRVTGGDPSTILGALQSNGRVFLINPNGIVIGAGAQINTTGFIASTLNLTDDDFIHGRMRFNANVANPGAITNAGEIRTPNGGFVYLIAPNVENNGLISTPSGEAILAAGNSVELVDSTDPSLRVKVSAQSQDINLSQLMVQSSGNIFSVVNRGKVSANTVTQDATGKIYFKSAGNIETTATSVVEAKGSANLNGGLFRGFADQSGVYKGVFDVSGKNGGFIETSGGWIDVNDAQIIARALDPSGIGGTWLLDPWDIQINASGASNYSLTGTTFGPTNSPSVITSALIEGQLDAGTSVIVDTTNVTGTEQGNINVNANITKSNGGNATLTLLAHNDIVIANGVVIQSNSNSLNVVLNADQDASGSGSILMQSGSKIISNGGDITLGGGANPLTDYATGSSTSGIKLDNATLDSTGGNIVLHGRGATTTGTAGTEIINGSVIQSDSGNITIYGQGGAGISTNRGVVLSNSTVQSNSGNIELDGTGGGSGSFSDGLLIAGGAVVRANTTGNILLEGYGAGGSGSNNTGIAIADNPTLIRTNIGTLNLTAHAISTGSASYGLVMWNGSELRSDTNQIAISAQSDAVIPTVLMNDPGTRIRASNCDVSITTINGGIYLNDGQILAGSSNTIYLNSAAGIYEAAAHQFTGGNVQATASGASAVLQLIGASNSITGSFTLSGNDASVKNTGDLTISGTLTPTTGATFTSSSGNVTYAQSSSLTINTPWTINTGAGKTATVGVSGDLNVSNNALTINNATTSSVVASGNINVTNGSINLTAANGTQTIGAGGSLNVLGNAAPTSVKASGSNSSEIIITTGNVNVTSGISGSATVSATQNMSMFVDGAINITSGGPPATISAGSGVTNVMLTTPNNYFVNGANAVIYNSGSGFVVNGAAGILNTNLFITTAPVLALGTGSGSAVLGLINFMNGELLNSTSVNNLISNIGKDNNPFGSGSDNKPAECVAL